MITPFEADVLAHTIRTGRYVTDETKVIQMGVDGLLQDFGPQALADGMHYFTVTHKGHDALAEWQSNQPKPAKPKPMSRSKRRYQAYLRVADCFESFHDYLLYMSRTDGKARE